MKRNKMKRKRRDQCPSPLLEDAPKRTKVHAQRKFAQGSNLNSPVITPVKEFERADRSSIDLTPDPVELLPIRRPNTEDFLTFLCFRGTPLLPPNLNFFNTASIVDTNGQVHEIKSESPKNGPIDTSAISKSGSGPSDRPFIAFGVRKRADPIVISKQMEKKRRHALALQALRRKYQEQKMAKIRAVTISKLSEKPSNRASVRTSSISKIEKTSQTVTSTTTKPQIQKNKVKIISTKHINVNTQTVRTLSSKMKSRMCLRSFRGRFIQQELAFRAVKKSKVPEKKVIHKKSVKKTEEVRNNSETPVVDKRVTVHKKLNNVSKQKEKKSKHQDLNIRVTRSHKIAPKPTLKGKQIIKRRILMSRTSVLVKSRVLRSQTLKNGNKVQGRLTRRCLERSGPSILLEKLPKRLYKKVTTTTNQTNKESKSMPKKAEEVVKTIKNPTNNVKKVEKPSNSENVKGAQEIDKSHKIVKVCDRVLRNDRSSQSRDISESKSEKPIELKKQVVSLIKKETAKSSEKVDVKIDNKKEKKVIEKTNIVEDKKSNDKKAINTEEEKKEIEKKPAPKKTNIPHKPIEVKTNETQKIKEKDVKSPQKEIPGATNNKEQKYSQRPSRKTKEAAAIYMEILSHKLVNEKKTDDDNISIDSFPELPNVKRTEQREIELKAKANISKVDKTNNKLEKLQQTKIETNSRSEKENILDKVTQKITETGNTDSNLNLESKIKLTKLQPIKKVYNKTKVDSKISVTTEQEKPIYTSISKNIMKAQAAENNLKNTNSAKTKMEPNPTDTKKIKLELPNTITVKNEIKTEILEELAKQAEKIHIDVKRENIKILNNEMKIDITKEKSNTKVQLTEIIEKTYGENKKENDNKKNENETKMTSKPIKSEEANSIIEKTSDTKNEDIPLKKVEQKQPEKTEPVKNLSDSDECLAKISNIKCLKINKESGNKTPTLVKNDVEKTTVSNVKQDKNQKKLLNKTVKKVPVNPASTKSNKKLSSDSDECLANISKAKDTKVNNNPSTRRQTRYNQKNKLPDAEDSEDSFHLDVKSLRKKLLSRRRSSKCSAVSKVKSSVNSTNDKEESDESTTSSKHVKAEANTNKKFSKKKSEKKVDGNFSDSDEEPLSKLTVLKKEEKSTEQLKEDILRIQKALIESPPPRTKIKKISKHKECKDKASDILKQNISEVAEASVGKPKRECAKLPSNYLPMFSSSDDEEKFFHGFAAKNEKTKETIYSHSSLDFLSKDLGRRFGKEKVNMSNEQIQKWLKDSAMAEIDSKKDDDLKFNQEIPTETSLNTSTTIDTEKLKNSLLECPTDLKEIISEKNISSTCEDNIKSPVYKSPSDRKPIFKKEKAKIAPNVGAFSANNESSIYAFEEEVEETVNTPFRRPARRPSSTATSKSEDEPLKVEESSNSGQFRKPVLRNEAVKIEDQKSHCKELAASTKRNQVSTSQKPTQTASLNRNIPGKNIKKVNLEQLEDAKYKVPSSPSASSSSSAKLYKRQNKHKTKPIEICNPIKMSDFPCNGPGELVEGPTFYPTDKEFQDPLEYIEKIGAKAEQFGICRIVPPSTFKPECKVSDDMRFTSYNQYIHKMLYRWGPNFKELMAIKKYLRTQNINLTQPPWIGGMEVDLPRLYQTVQNLGGLKEVIEKEKWSKVSDIMRIPKSAQDRVTKLDDIYCKYLLPYDTLSPDEREKLLDEVETSWAKRESKELLKTQKSEETAPENESDSESDNDVDECIMKGRNMALNAFYRIARNTMSMWFRNSEPTSQEIEQEFWKHVVQRQNHICVHSGSIDSGSWGYGFAVSKNSPFARHAWNLKVLTNNSGSVLRSLGPVMGVTVPTLHVGMVFSGCCWYRDPHSLPWIEYLHTGGSKIWYGVPNSVGDLFQKALTKLVPNYCRNQGLWLPSDTVMLPPSLLIESGVSLSRIVQEPGQFIVVFPKAFTSSLSTGYVVSESVFFAPPSWLRSAQMTFDLLRDSCEPSMFSLDRLYLSIVNDQRTSIDVLKQMIPIVSSISLREKEKRESVRALGVKSFEVLPPPEAPNARRKKKSQESGDYECEVCRINLFISMIMEQDAIYCLDHASKLIEKKTMLPENCKFLYTYSDEELDGLVSKINTLIEQKLQKKVFNKFSGMPTLLNKQN